MVGCQNPTYWNGATICFCSRSILFLTSDKCDLHMQEHPIVDKLLHLDYVTIGHGFLGTFFHVFFSWLAK